MELPNPPHRARRISAVDAGTIPAWIEPEHKTTFKRNWIQLITDRVRTEAKRRRSTKIDCILWRVRSIDWELTSHRERPWLGSINVQLLNFVAMVTAALSNLLRNSHHWTLAERTIYIIFHVSFWFALPFDTPVDSAGLKVIFFVTFTHFNWKKEVWLIHLVYHDSPWPFPTLYLKTSWCVAIRLTLMMLQNKEVGAVKHGGIDDSIDKASASDLLKFLGWTLHWITKNAKIGMNCSRFKIWPGRIARNHQGFLE